MLENVHTLPKGPGSRAQASATASCLAQRECERLDSRVLWRPRTSVWTLAAILSAFALAEVRLAPDALNDDAFISLRYARNLARGDGLVFNPTDRVEGYTNFLWTVALALPHQWGVDAVRAMQVGSCVTGLALVAMAFLLLRRHGAFAAAAAALLAAAQPFLVAESVGGLETTLFALLVLAALERDAAEAAGTARPGTWAVLLGLATLVRPEGALSFACLVGWHALEAKRRSALPRALLVYAACIVPFVLFRLAYYHDWVPNTYHAKVGFGSAQLERGAQYAWNYGLRAMLPALPLALAAFGHGGWQRRAACVAVAHTAWVIAVGGDYAPTGRFLILPVAIVAALAGGSVATLWQRGRKQRGLALLSLAVLAAWAVYDESRVLRARRWPQVYRTDLAARRFMGEWLAASEPPSVTIAVGSIGAIGYYSDRRLLDTFGLTDREIGRLPVEWMGHTSAGHEKGDADIILRRAPKLILFDRAFLLPRELGLDEFLAMARSPSERLLVEDPRFYEQYGLKTVATRAGIVHCLERVEP